MSTTEKRIRKARRSFIKKAPKDSLIYKRGFIVGYRSPKGSFPGAKENSKTDEDKD